jgi:hypothetical protein
MRLITPEEVNVTRQAARVVFQGGVDACGRDVGAWCAAGGCICASGKDDGVYAEVDLY